MVLVDAFGPAIKRLMGRFWPRYDHLLNFPPDTPIEHEPGWETLDVDAAIRDLQRVRPMPRMPLAVISKTEQFTLTPSFPTDVARRLLQVWPIAQNPLVALEPQTPHVLVRSLGHKSLRRGAVGPRDACRRRFTGAVETCTWWRAHNNRRPARASRRRVGVTTTR